MVIAPSVLTDFTPLFKEAGSDSVVTQFDKDDVEAAGLVKFDFLGLRTLTIIDRAVAIINALPERAGDPLDVARIPLDDAATYTLLKIGAHHRRVPARIARHEGPDPPTEAGPLRGCGGAGGAVPARAAAVGHGAMTSSRASTPRSVRPSTTCIPRCKPVLEATYGVILYQEQVMQIAQVLSGYTLGGADLLRRAMGKKKPEEMAKQRSSVRRWRGGARRRRRTGRRTSST